MRNGAHCNFNQQVNRTLPHNIQYKRVVQIFGQSEISQVGYQEGTHSHVSRLPLNELPSARGVPGSARRKHVVPIHMVNDLHSGCSQQSFSHSSTVFTWAFMRSFASPLLSIQLRAKCWKKHCFVVVPATRSELSRVLDWSRSYKLSTAMGVM
uniref:Uncharacterized protein n=1 Tax=Globisporangium ultimum (strain ATCC 200006 / CBS 805.95 / DAOM BR144) TaxID=431595 RepID=K3XBK7_GLOUD